MSFQKNTLNFASYSYNASTNTPDLSYMKDGTIFEVSTEGKLSGVSIEGATVGADSYLLVGDKVLFKNGIYELSSPKIKNGTIINFGTGGLFSTFKLANDYISQRVYTGVILNQLSNTTETASVDVQNPCGGRLVIMGNGFTIDFSGTANTNCTLSGNNIYIDNFEVKANYAVEPACVIKGVAKHSNGVTVQNINATGQALTLAGSFFTAVNVDSFGRPNNVADVVTLASGASGVIALGGNSSTAAMYGLIVTTGTIGFTSIKLTIYLGGITITSGSIINPLNSSFYVLGNIVTGGGSFNAGSSCSNYFSGAINTGGGSFNAGFSCSNCFSGAINYGAGTFTAGETCINRFTNPITGTSLFTCGETCNNRFGALVSIGSGQLHYGVTSNNFWTAGASGTGGVNATGGTYNNCNGQPMPAGTPVSGTITAAFIRVS